MINSWLTDSLTLVFFLLHTATQQCWTSVGSIPFRISESTFVDLWSFELWTLEFAEFVDFEISPTNPVHNSQQNQHKIPRDWPSHAKPFYSGNFRQMTLRKPSFPHASQNSPGLIQCCCRRTVKSHCFFELNRTCDLRHCMVRFAADHCKELREANDEI